MQAEDSTMENPELAALSFVEVPVENKENVLWPCLLLSKRSKIREAKAAIKHGEKEGEEADKDNKAFESSTKVSISEEVPDDEEPPPSPAPLLVYQSCQHVEVAYLLGKAGTTPESRRLIFNPKTCSYHDNMHIALQQKTPHFKEAMQEARILKDLFSAQGPAGAEFDVPEGESTDILKDLFSNEAVGAEPDVQAADLLKDLFPKEPVGAEVSLLDSRFPDADPEFSESRAVFVPVPLLAENDTTVPWPGLVFHDIQRLVDGLKARGLLGNTMNQLSITMSVCKLCQQQEKFPFVYLFGNPPADVVMPVSTRGDLIRYSTDLSAVRLHQQYSQNGFMNALNCLLQALAWSAPNKHSTTSKGTETQKVEVDKSTNSVKAKVSLAKKQTKKRRSETVLSDVSNRVKKVAANKKSKKPKPRAIQQDAKPKEKTVSFDPLRMEQLPTFQDVKATLEDLGYSFRPDLFCLPGMDPDLNPASQKGQDHFPSERSFREHLCRHGIPVGKGKNPRRGALDKKLEVWVASHRLAALLDELHRPFSSVTKIRPDDFRAMLKNKCDIEWTCNKWRIGSSGARLEDEDFHNQVSKEGIPFNISTLCDEDRLSLEQYVGLPDFRRCPWT
ncbi:Cell division control protein [Seminavis robusta]|uniref:Cell division control protein n=1 Tax=Seminavis robusta TaxID=568900 RepID=A0A9N8DS27_9STRA|nr:Cell division control protein [Seminavis robusta]|eukprot:Sro242_g096540.1 Cell division control protein (616) ;mRNA; r:9615-11462